MCLIEKPREVTKMRGVSWTNETKIVHFEFGHKEKVTFQDDYNVIRLNIT